MNGYWEHVCDYPDASSYSFECYQHLPQLHSSFPTLIIPACIAGWFLYIAVADWISDLIEDWKEKRRDNS